MIVIAQGLVEEKIIGSLNVKGLLQRSDSQNGSPLRTPHFVGLLS